jgi:hypothetical protein
MENRGWRIEEMPSVEWARQRDDEELSGRLLLRFAVGSDLQLRHKVKVHNTHGIIGLEDDQSASAGSGGDKVGVVDGNVSPVGQVHHERSERLRLKQLPYSLNGHAKLLTIHALPRQVQIEF